MNRPPARVGDEIDAIDTPALVIDLSALERNLERMASFAERANIRLRPHAKTHKCAMIARKQLARGAVGVCCQKVSEAEAMVAGGVADVLVSYEIVGESKVTRLAALARDARVSVLADNPDQIEAYGAAAERFDVVLSVFVDLHPGGIGAGVSPGLPAVELARKIVETPGLRFAGIQAYQGSAQHIRSFGERREVSEAWIAKVAETRDMLEEAGIPCEFITGAGTGTYTFEGTSGVFNEIQPGSYAVMDVDYGLNLDEKRELVSEFENSLFILSTVMSRNFEGFAVVDAGVKAGNIDQAMPKVWKREGLEYVRASDEHGGIQVAEGMGGNLKTGDRLWLIPGHCDPTINLHDWIVAVRAGVVEAVWPVTARGAIL